jgi:protein tyrosine/serine phosphatase
VDTPDRRRLHWPDCRNCRDLGGLPTSDGRRIRAGALIRSDSLDRLTPEGVRALRDRGVRRIVDLRSPEEAAAYPGPFVADPAYRLVPLVDPTNADEDWTARDTLSAIYRASVEVNAPFIAACVAAIADSPAGTVVVHCYAGKDRTGLTVALALTVAGVPADVIAADYAYTAVCLREVHETRLATVTDPVERLALAEKMSSRPETILDTLAHVADRYGDVVGYLRTHGLTTVALADLRNRLRD